MAETVKTLTPILREIARVISSVQSQLWALELALRIAGVVTPEQIASARTSVAERVKEASDRLDQESAARLFDMLQEFEGPPQ